MPKPVVPAPMPRGEPAPAAGSPRLPRRPSVAVVGATGLVGESLLAVLAERGFPLGELRLLAGARSAGGELSWQGRPHRVSLAEPGSFEGIDLAFFAAGGGVSRALVPGAVAGGTLAVDKSSAFREDPEVPLVVPEVNGRTLESARGLVACPNCTSIGLVLALEPLRQAFGLAGVTVATYQAVSGAGRAGLAELTGKPPGDPVFPRPIAGDVLAQCGELDAEGHATEERKVAFEVARILDLEGLPIEATCVRVPVAVGHGAAVWVETERPVEGPGEVVSAWEAFPGVRYYGPGGPPPTPREVAGTDDVRVGRLRVASGGRRVAFWQVADNLRRGAATNAVAIAEALLG